MSREYSLSRAVCGGELLRCRKLHGHRLRDLRGGRRRRRHRVCLDGERLGPLRHSAVSVGDGTARGARYRPLQAQSTGSHLGGAQQRCLLPIQIHRLLQLQAPGPGLLGVVKLNLRVLKSAMPLPGTV